MSDPLLLPEEGLVKVLDWKAAAFASAGIKARLFKNDHTPALGDVLGDYDAADFDGYDDIEIGNWDPAAIVSAGLARIQSQLLTWQPTDVTAGCDVYGYVVFDPNDNKVLWAERDPSAPVRVGDDLRPYSWLLRMTEANAP